MEIKQQIQGNAKEFLKSGDQLASGALRMALAAIISKEKEKRFKVSKEKPDLKEQELIKESELTDDEVINTLLSEIKKKKEIEILQKYLPEQISTEELKKIIEESINKTGAKDAKDIGKVMADLMPKVKGRADSGEIG